MKREAPWSLETFLMKKLTNQPTNQPTKQLSNYMKQSPSWKANRSLSSQEIPRIFMEPEGSLLHSKWPAICPYPGPDLTRRAVNGTVQSFLQKREREREKNLCCPGRSLSFLSYGNRLHGKLICAFLSGVVTPLSARCNTQEFYFLPTEGTFCVLMHATRNTSQFKQ